MITTKLNGWVRQVPSDKDLPFVGVKGKGNVIEDTGDVDLRKWCSPVEDQRSIGACCPNAVVGALEMLRIRFGKPHIDLSRLFVYYNSRLMHGAQDRDEGTIIRLAIGTLNTLGTCPESLWKYDTSAVFVRPSWAAYQAAYGNKVGRYELISGTGRPRIDACIDALSAGYPVVFGMQVTQSFVESERSDPYFSGPFIGAHAMMLCGHRASKKQFIVRNSWGDRWSDHGYCFLDESVFDDNDAADFWVIYEPPQLNGKPV